VAASGGGAKAAKAVCLACRFPKTHVRPNALFQYRNLKMPGSAHAYVRGSTAKFYEWLEWRRPYGARWPGDLDLRRIVTLAIWDRSRMWPASFRSRYAISIRPS
jgi:hypothetical protein